MGVNIVDVPGSNDKYVALFNAQSNADPFNLSHPDYQSRRIDGEPKLDVIDINVLIKNTRRLGMAVTGHILRPRSLDRSDGFRPGRNTEADRPRPGTGLIR